MILVIDNYDSFVYNLARYLERLGQEVAVVRNDALSSDAIERLRPEAIVISPGPCAPQQAGCSLDVVRRYYQSVPILGVCLGHQTIAEALGGQIVRAAEPMHGRTSTIRHSGGGLFADVPETFTACRYHSLVVDEQTLPVELAVTARSECGAIMALAHRRYCVHGVQFHPEAILTEYGYRMLANFLRLASVAQVADEPSFDEELLPRRGAVWTLPERPVTF